MARDGPRSPRRHCRGRAAAGWHACGAITRSPPLCPAAVLLRMLLLPLVLQHPPALPHHHRRAHPGAPPRQVFLYSFARKLDRIFSMLSDSLASPVRACALVARAQCAWRRPLTCTSALSIGEASIEHAILKYTRAVRTRTREHTLIHSFDARRGMNAYAQLRLTLTVCSQRRTSCYDEPARRGDRYHRHGATYASPRTMRANASDAPFA